MASSWRCQAQRNGSVLVWLPVLLVFPLLDLHGGPTQVALQVLLAVAMGLGCLAAVLPAAERRRRLVPGLGLVVLAAAVVAGSTQGEAWLTAWVLLAITSTTVLRGRWLAVGLFLITAGSLTAAWLNGSRDFGLWFGAGGGVLLSGVATTAFLRLIETNEELRRTREELARAAVAEERERFSRDLHDLLGHTLSVMVVKAQAVRRLAHRDPDAVASHAADIEEVGRRALLDVREAVDGMRTPTLADELAGARRALDAAGISAEVAAADLPMPAETDRILAWVVREAVTNVLRHSGATHCRLGLDVRDGRVHLRVADDGVGGPSPATGRAGGLDGLRHRLVAAGGRLEAEPGPDGFRLLASLPVGRLRGRPDDSDEDESGEQVPARVTVDANAPKGLR